MSAALLRPVYQFLGLLRREHLLSAARTVSGLVGGRPLAERLLDLPGRAKVNGERALLVRLNALLHEELGYCVGDKLPGTGTGP